MSGRVLILNGSMRGNGNTAALLNMLVGQNETDCTVVAHGAELSPCVNCGFCSAADACQTDDAMQGVYRAAETAEFAVLASPVYFGNLTGFLLDVLSRFQRYCKRGAEKLPRIGPPKQGAVILTAGGAGDMVCAERTARIFMKLLNVESPAFIISRNTDAVVAERDEQSVEAIAALKKRWFWV